MSTGIPSLDLKPTDPLTIDNIDLNRDIPPFTIRTKLDNVSLILFVLVDIVLMYVLCSFQKLLHIKYVTINRLLLEAYQNL